VAYIAPYLPLILTLIAVGGLAGLCAGLFGIGGGAVMVPAFYFAFGALGVPENVVTHCAVATSSAIIIVNAIRSTRSHHSHHAVDWDLLWPKNPLLSYALWIGVGAFLAAIWLAPKMSGQALTLLFAIVAGVISLQFIFGRPDWKIRDTVPGGLARPVVGGSVGVLSSLMGIGGGSLTVPLMSICGVPIHRASFSLGYVNILGFALVASIAFLTIPLGAKLAHSMSQRKLKLIFGILLVLVAANMARKALF